MQLMPETAKEIAGELGIPYDEGRLLADPQYNMALGTAYIEKMRDRYQGDNALALAAYNAGPGNVDKWIKEFGDPRTGEISEADWIAKIPFEETRNYTGKIISQLEQPEPGSVTYARAIKQANKIEDPELRDLTVARIEDLPKAQDLEDRALLKIRPLKWQAGGYASVDPRLLAS